MASGSDHEHAGAERGAARALAGARVLVTGASSGIGAAVAAHLDAGGARVGLHGRDRSALERVAAGLSGSPVTVCGDLTGDPIDDRRPSMWASVAGTVATAATSMGGLDVVVANAGAGWAGPFDEMTPYDLGHVLDINLVATAHLIRCALPHLRASDRGAIVVVGSIAGLLPVGGEAAYSAAKAGVTALASALRSELRSDGITVSVVSPGVVDTPFFSRRNRPYARNRPRPIPASQVAEAVAHCIVTGRPSVVVPRWLGLPVWLRGALPGPYRLLSDRFG